MKLDASDPLAGRSLVRQSSDGLSKFESFVALRVAFCALMLLILTM